MTPDNSAELVVENAVAELRVCHGRPLQGLLLHQSDDPVHLAVRPLSFDVGELVILDGLIGALFMLAPRDAA